MTQISPKAKKLARRLLRENRRGRNWRDIAREDYGNQITYALLNKFASRRGEWLPNEQAQIVLGLAKPKPPKQPRPPIPEWVKPIRKKIAAMAKQTRIDLGLQ